MRTDIWTNTLIQTRSLKGEERERARQELDSKSPPVSEGEYMTFAALHKHCKKAVKEKKNTFVVYFHTKSTGHGVTSVLHALVYIGYNTYYIYLNVKRNM